MITSLPKVQLSGHAESQAFGGEIQRLMTNFQFNEAPSTVTLTIVNKSGTYTTPSLGQRATLDIGDSLTFSGKIWNFTKSQEAGSRTLEVTLRDNSDILDKFFVGLTNVHGRVQASNKTFPMSIKCPECEPGDPDGGTKDEKEGNKTVGPIGVKREVASENDIRGGLILVGTEQFTQNYCDLPDVDYSFSELLAALRGKISISGGSVSSKLRESFTGSLRDVLNSWCGELGLSFIWNFTNDSLHIYDFSAGLSLPDFNGDEAIHAITETQSLDNTFQQVAISYFKKGAEINSTSKQLNKTYYQETKWRPLEMGNIIGTYGGKRTEANFFVSCALAKYYEPFRKFYNMMIASDSTAAGRPVNEDMSSYTPATYSKTNTPNKANYSWTKTSTPWEVLGIKPLAFYGKESSESIRTMINSIDSTILQTVSPNGQFMLAYYDEALESKWVNFEQYVADSFMGRYYIKNKLPLGVATCTPNYFYQSTVEANPPGQYYTQRYLRSLPFYQAFVDFDITKQLPKGSFYIVSRDPTWDLTEQEFAEELGLGGDDAKDEDSFTTFLPKRIPLSGALRNRVQALSTVAPLSIPVTEFSNKNLVLIFIPSYQDIQKLCRIQIAYDGMTMNKSEQLKSVEPARPKSSTSPDKCPLTCEENILEPVCKASCSNYREIEPPSIDFLGPTSSNGHSVLVKFKDKQVRVVGPVDGFYRGYLKIQRECKFVKPKVQQIFGSVPNSVNTAVAEMRVVEKDLTQAFEDYTSDEPQILVNGQPTSPASLAGSIASECNVSNTRPTEEVTISMNEIKVLGGPTAGLTGVSISLDSGGLVCTLSYKSRPAKYPTPDDVIKKIEAGLRNSKFG